MIYFFLIPNVNSKESKPSFNIFKKDCESSKEANEKLARHIRLDTSLSNDLVYTVLKNSIIYSESEILELP